MKMLLEPTRTSKKKDNSTFSKKLANGKMTDRLPVLGGLGVLLKKTKKPFFKFYKVLKNDTSVVEVSANDFKPFDVVYSDIKTACVLNSTQCPFFSLPADEFMFCGFLSEIKAMKHAKAGALKHIAKLIEGGDTTYDLLLEYRETHYYDLNFHLTEKNITELELRSEFPARRTKKEFS
jgi:hypothetical protein